MTTTLFLIRHGETEWNRLNRIQGHSDIPLSETGVRQAEKLANYLAQQPISSLYSSDLKRAVETARPLGKARGVSVQLLPELRERSFGKLEGCDSFEVRDTIRKMGEMSYGVEPYSQVQQRAYQCLTQLADKHLGETIGVVSHGGLILAFLRQIMDEEQGESLPRISNTGVSILHYEPSQWQIIALNDTSHL